MSLKRIKYVSSFSRPMTPAEIDDLAQEAGFNNEVLEITGILAVSGSLFFQILEGPQEAVDQIYSRILQDNRHVHVMLLREEVGELERLFPDWTMRKVDLSEDAENRLAPLRAILEAVFAQTQTVGQLTHALERGIWLELNRK